MHDPRHGDPVRHVLFISGARSDYDLMSPVFAPCRQLGLKVSVIAAAGHLSQPHGFSVLQIREDDIDIAAELETLLSSDTWTARSLSFAHLLQALTQEVARIAPSLIYVAGDREEALAGALVGNFLQIPVAHAHGGDRCIASDIDEVFRPAISKLAHIHFTATEGHRQRLVRMGEAPETVFATGSASLDRLGEDRGDLANVSGHFGIELASPYFLVLHHPTATLENDDVEDYRQLLEGLRATGADVLLGAPNFDPGNTAMRDLVRQYSSPQLHVYGNLPRSVFIPAFRNAAAIVGNSSALLVEAGFLRVPAILVGHRQDFREAGSHVLRVDAEAREITRACALVCEPSFRANLADAPSLYGDGKSGTRIAEVLRSFPLSNQLLRKTIPY